MDPTRYSRGMPAEVAMMPLAELVQLVNECGTLPRTLDGRSPGADAELTTLADELHPIFAARQCADVYVDTSPAGRRRFCCLTCQNRARAAAFRQRHAKQRDAT